MSGRSQPTPGPWHYRPSQTRHVVNVDGESVCRVHRGKKAQHNGPIIAAAPDMLAALEYISTRLDDIVDIRIAQEAIAKAKGETE